MRRWSGLGRARKGAAQSVRAPARLRGVRRGAGPPVRGVEELAHGVASLIHEQGHTGREVRVFKHSDVRTTHNMHVFDENRWRAVERIAGLARQT